MVTNVNRKETTKTKCGVGTEGLLPLLIGVVMAIAIFCLEGSVVFAASGHLSSEVHMAELDDVLITKNVVVKDGAINVDSFIPIFDCCSVCGIDSGAVRKFTKYGLLNGRSESRGSFLCSHCVDVLNIRWPRRSKNANSGIAPYVFCDGLTAISEQNVALQGGGVGDNIESTCWGNKHVRPLLVLQSVIGFYECNELHHTNNGQPYSNYFHFLGVTNQIGR